MRLTAKTLTYLFFGFYVPFVFAQRVSAPFLDGFESGNFGSPWLTGGTSSWQIAAAGAPEGNFFVRSGSISHSQSSFLELKVSLSQTGRVSFLRKVDSEQGFDFLKFFIDGGQAVAEWSGTQNWQVVSFDLTAGNHDLSWIYFKDGSVSSGTDAAFIDDVRVELTGGSPPPGVTLLTPANTSTLSDPTPFFDWTNAAGATGYRIQINNSLDFSSPMINVVVGSSNYQQQTNLSDGNYFWRVQASNSSGSGPWSPGLWVFTIETTVPGVPTLVSPANGSSTSDRTPTFSWNAPSGATSYIIQIDNNSNFSSPLVNLAVSNTSFTPVNNLSAGTYFWRVQARNSAGSSNWSTVWSVTIITVPGVPTLLTPANGSSTSDRTPSFDWTSSSGANNYDIQVDNNSNFSSPVINASPSSSNFTPSSSINPGTYFWRVRAKNSAGSSAWSAVWSVTINPTPSALIMPDAPTISQCGQEFFVPIVIENVSNLSGVSFDLNYQTAHINYVSAQATPPQGAASNLLGTNLIFLPTPSDANGRVSIGVTQRAGIGATGSGPVAWIRFVSSGNTPDPTNITWTLSNVTASNPSGGSISLSPNSATTSISCGCIVWPGDANNDGVVNSADVLALGQFFGRTGPNRPGASTSWNGQNTTCWSAENATFADCNGNGIVGSEDVLPIGQNFGRTHSASVVSLTARFREDTLSTPISQGSELSSQTPIIEPVVLDEVSGDNFTVSVRVKDVSELFGLAFDLVYTASSSAVEALSAQPGPFMGNDLLFLPTISSLDKRVSVGITRKAGQGGVNGEGIVVTILFKGFETAPFGTPVTCTLENVTANDENGNPITFDVRSALTIVTDVEETNLKSELPSSFVLHRNFPNPFNPETRIGYDLPIDTPVKLEIFNLLGRKIRILVDATQPPGSYSVIWDGRNDFGRSVASGVYVYQLRTREKVLNRKLLLVK